LKNKTFRGKKKGPAVSRPRGGGFLESRGGEKPGFGGLLGNIGDGTSRGASKGTWRLYSGGVSALHFFGVTATGGRG